MSGVTRERPLVSIMPGRSGLALYPITRCQLHCYMFRLGSGTTVRTERMYLAHIYDRSNGVCSRALVLVREIALWKA